MELYIFVLMEKIKNYVEPNNIFRRFTHTYIYINNVLINKDYEYKKTNDTN